MLHASSGTFGTFVALPNPHFSILVLMSIPHYFLPISGIYSVEYPEASTLLSLITPKDSTHL